MVGHALALDHSYMSKDVNALLALIIKNRPSVGTWRAFTSFYIYE